MIDSVEFKNFKALRSATLQLSRFTLIVGANGSGKSTAVQALELARDPRERHKQQIISAELRDDPAAVARVRIRWTGAAPGSFTELAWGNSGVGTVLHECRTATIANPCDFDERVLRLRSYSFDASLIGQPTLLQVGSELSRSGSGLAGVLDNIRDSAPERFDTLNQELARWLPEYDRILFSTPRDGHRAFSLRTCIGHHSIPAAELSQGTLIALAILTLAYLPQPPLLVCMEEPEHGIHPRLLRYVQEALYRLAYPESFGEQRDPVQVMATTQSPYFLDLFKDHPEEIVLAEKVGLDAQFKRLVDTPYINEILQDAPLGEVWYTGVLGGVPAAA